jgi:hypothetical protein
MRPEMDGLLSMHGQFEIRLVRETCAPMQNLIDVVDFQFPVSFMWGMGACRWASLAYLH